MQTEQQKRILVVDDDEDIRDLLKEYLEKNGFSVITAADGQAMRQFWPAQRLDLIVLDIMMPGDDGFTLCKEIRARSRIPIIMLTAKGREVEKEKGLALGANDYVTKPFSTSELTKRVKELLGDL